MTEIEGGEGAIECSIVSTLISIRRMSKKLVSDV